MAGGVRYAMQAQAVGIILCGEGRPRKAYEDGQRTDKSLMLDDKPLLRYPAVFSVDGRTVLGVGSLDTTSELSNIAFGEVYRGLPGHVAQIVVSPSSQFEVRLTVQIDSVVPVRPAEEK